jgi:hypothetical protein
MDLVHRARVRRIELSVVAAALPVARLAEHERDAHVVRVVGAAQEVQAVALARREYVGGPGPGPAVRVGAVLVQGADVLVHPVGGASGDGERAQQRACSEDPGHTRRTDAVTHG